jgi:hypothetical protein
MAETHILLTSDEINAILREVIDKFLIPRFNQLGMKASGKWIDSLQTEYDGKRVGKIKGQFYTQFLTRGRNKNRDQSPEALRRWAVWAGNTFIKQWCLDKGITADPIAVAYSIAKNGTSWLRQGGSDLLEVLEEPETLDFIRSKIRTALQPKIANQMRRTAQQTFRRNT